ncbi:hypothetical protein KC19_3G224900 [Ceratodon purpureus]|uniref:Late embryogenesis abundant protein LEA-2 subgroup domain-containing protein n=1 Tax=Ceratodon purpureus TaxID=3225 RepID=A0A8T0INS1_CERPU|nr:hypothetical protein KC19_3G224900 [Ceratodon purpureus]
MATKMSKTLSGSGRLGSRVYPTEPTPMHFTQLHFPKSSVLPPPATYHHSRRRHRSCGSLGCCCCSLFATLCSLLFTLVFLLGIATLITWLILRPIYAPRYSLEDVQLKTFSVSPQNALNADVVYGIRTENPNGKIEFKYGVIDMETSYMGQVFGRSAVPAFSQGHRNVTTLTSQLVVKNYEFVPASVGSALATDMQRGSVALHARGSTRVRVKVGAITSFAVRVHVNCDFTVKPPTATSPGSVINKSCRISR